MSEYHYIQSEPGLWTVGTGRPGKGGDWEPESDHESPEEAAARVNFLNGGANASIERIVELESALREMAIAHHHHARHEGRFEDCGYLNCRKAQIVLAKRGES